MMIVIVILRNHSKFAVLVCKSAQFGQNLVIKYQYIYIILMLI